ncbi:MAG: T9SS type A sorting domain-containing protein [candidate division WOR-3 bacterium]|nr:T9SS type A sorting domain-containing protein [candidate division WOR-3 bacterium]
MKKYSLLLVLLLPLTFYAQVIDTVIRFNDNPWDLLYVSEGNELYLNFGSSNFLLVLDCSTNQVKKTLFTPYSASYGIRNWNRDKIYYVFGGSAIGVIDNRTDSIIKWINYGARRAPCYNSRDDKIYATNGASVAVIDCETDSIIKIITQPYFLSGFIVWDSIGNKVYCGSGFSRDEVTVINCANDSVVAVINTRLSKPIAAVFNLQRRKVYVAGNWGFYGAVIDAVGDTLIKDFYIGFNFWVSLIWNSLEDKVYWPSGEDGDSLHIIDCLNDSIIKSVVPGGQLECINLANWSNRLYVVARDYDSTGRFNILYVLDCRIDSVISQMRFGRLATAMTCNPIDHLIYITDIGDSTLYVIRDEIPGIDKASRLDASRLTPEIYPNPAKTVIRIRIPRASFTPNASRPTLKIFDVSGKLIKEVLNSTSAQEHKEEIRISLKGIHPGIYFLQIGTEIKKFLIIK